MNAEWLWSIGLIGGNKLFLETLLVLCYALYNKRVALNIFYLLLFAITMNAALKEIWQIPLNPGVNSNTYAFPSGHMQASSLVYLSLALHTRKTWIWITAGILMLIVATSIQHFGYHNWPDLCGGFCVAGIISISFWYLSKYLALQPVQYAMVFLGAQLAILYLWLPHIPRFFWLWNVVALNLGVNLGLALFNRYNNLGVKAALILIIIFLSAMITHIHGGIFTAWPLKESCKYFMFGAFFAFIAPFLEQGGQVIKSRFPKLCKA